MGEIWQIKTWRLMGNCADGRRNVVIDGHYCTLSAETKARTELCQSEKAKPRSSGLRWMAITA